MAGLPGGGFVVVWADDAPGGGNDVRLRRLGPGGVPFADDQVVNTATADFEALAAVDAASDGSFVVAWQDYFPHVQARRYGADGAPLGAQEGWSGSAYDGDAAVGMEPWGGSLVATTYDDGFSGDDVRVHRWTDEGTNGIGAIVVNGETAGNQRRPRVAVDGDGDAVVVWETPSHVGPPGDANAAVVLRRGLPTPLPPSALAARWRLDEGSGNSVFDSAGAEANDANLTGAVRIPGRFGGALAFDGVDDFVYVLATADLLLADEVAISAWVRPDALGAAMPEAFGGIFDAVEDNYVLYLDEGAAELRFKVTNAAGAFARPGIPQSQLQVGRWHHVVGTFDGATARIWLDGVLVDGEALAGPIRTALAQQPAIGRNGGSGAGAAQHHFAGAVDDLMVWRRVPSDDEIRLLARPPLLRDGFASGNTAAWHARVP